MISYSQLTKPSESDQEQLSRLIRQLSSAPRRLTLEELHVVTSSHVLLIARDSDLDDRIVGTALLVVIQSLSHISASIEDVVVDETHRGRGVGRELTKQLITHARCLNVERIDLCSEPYREAANALYRSLGFVLKDTNLYRLKL